jgi:hypothetical protein
VIQSAYLCDTRTNDPRGCSLHPGGQERRVFNWQREMSHEVERCQQAERREKDHDSKIGVTYDCRNPILEADDAS